MHILMVAAENGALPGGKVGGIGDVIRDLPPELAASGEKVTVITPGYQHLSQLPDAECINSLSVVFKNALVEVFLYRIHSKDQHEGVDELVLDCPAFAPCGEGEIYCHDKDEPFAVDAEKFALFCNAVCLAVVSGAVEQPDVIHLHDWHAALVLFLRHYSPAFTSMKKIPCVFTVHNLSIQGIRPLRDNTSSLETWFPGVSYEELVINDPGHPDCVNMMRMGINLADKVHVVSPTYAREILKPSDYSHGFIGGEGLEQDLQAVADAGILFGILNGCEYDDIESGKPHKKSFVELALSSLDQWVDEHDWIRSTHYFTYKRLLDWQDHKKHDHFIVASVGRLSGQKVHILRESTKSGNPALVEMLDYLKHHNGLYLMLGSGDHKYESFMTELMKQYSNFIFMNGFSEELAGSLYRFGDLFLMPSSYEPCGISQMLAMRAGVPCLVHRTGGLADTVKNGVNGFSFAGTTPLGQAGNLVKTLKKAHHLFSKDEKEWDNIRKNAADSRFHWPISEYKNKLYR